MLSNLFIAIETSCDETSLAIGGLPTTHENFLRYINSVQIHGSIIASQAKLFAQYGGVIPEISARHHAEQIFELFDIVLEQACTQTQTTREELLNSISSLYVTTQPGLASALRVGVEFAKVLAALIKSITNHTIPVTPIHHLHGHIVSAFFENQENHSDSDIFPHLHLLVSGGNTQLLYMQNPQDFTVIGQTLDDAAGECLDKIGRMVGLSYPAGATIGQIVGNNFTNPVQLPVGMKGKTGVQFSYSGLKTAVRYLIQNHVQDGLVYEQPLTSNEIDQLKQQDGHLNTKLSLIKNILISTQTVVITQLLQQTKKALASYSVQSLGLSGGVSANNLLRKYIADLHPNFFIAPLKLTGDNAVMIGLAGISQNYFDK